MPLQAANTEEKLTFIPALKKETGSSGYPSAPRRSLCAFYQDEGLIGSLKNDHSKKAAAFAFTIFEKWLRRRSAYNYAVNKNPASDEEGFYIDDAVYRDCAFLLIEAMIYASRADLLIDQDEHNSMYRVYKAIFAHDDVRGLIDSLLTAPINLEDLTKRVQFPEEAMDIYELSALILQGSHFLETGYLEELAAMLKIDPSLKHTLDESAQKRAKGAKE